MDLSSFLLELYGRIPPLAGQAVAGLGPEQLVTPPAPAANPIAWLVWHVARVQDHHVAGILEDDQLWVTGDWAGRFGLAPDPSNTGYGHTAPEVETVRPHHGDDLLGYLGAVDRRTRAVLEGLEAADLDRIVDRRWNPPVTWASALSASPTTACSILARPRTCGACWASNPRRIGVQSRPNQPTPTGLARSERTSCRRTWIWPSTSRV